MISFCVQAISCPMSKHPILITAGPESTGERLLMKAGEPIRVPTRRVGVCPVEDPRWAAS
jgi:hypothetical protein